MDRAQLRSFLLVLTGCIFLGIALAGLVAPEAVADWYALTLQGTDGLNEYRAVFIGFWTGLFLMMAYAAQHPENVPLGNFAAILVLCQSLGRCLSVLLDGLPSFQFIFWGIGEMTLSLLILALAPDPLRARAEPPA
ncbi:MAG TPA: DUF4345 domain-containing protein [Longimicrobiaceae bacterium]|nr:DUF4345 domain-containing protein [Longimicrobiaceae bacterium]